MGRSARRKAVLVVEDDRDFRELISLHLLESDYAVRAVADGAEAIRACLNSVPDLVISDVHMPRIDGLELVASMRSIESLRQVPVIFLSIDETAAERLGADGNVVFLRKPILASSLLRAVANALGKVHAE